MNRIIYFLFLILLVSCHNTENQQLTYIKGFLPNTKEKVVVLYENDKAIDSITLDENKKFLLEMDIKEETLYNIEIDHQYVYVYVEPKDSLVFTGNISNLSESLSFSGKGANINNFMLSQWIENEKVTAFIKRNNALEPIEFKKKIDSIYEQKLQHYQLFVEENPSLSENAKKIALVSATYPLFREVESYPFIYQRNSNNSVANSLPKDFYNHRNFIEFDNSSLEYYRPYYSYMVMLINNLTFKKYNLTHNAPDINKDEEFHLKKIQIIDSLFPSGMMRDNLYRNAAYAYIFNIQNKQDCQCYMEEFYKYNEKNIHKAELEQVFIRTIDLQKGRTPPEFEIIDLDGNYYKLSNIVRPKVTVVYFWSVNQREMSNLIFNRILQLKELFPNVEFIGIDVGQNVSEWCNTVFTSSNRLVGQQFHSTNFDDLSRKLLINNISKTLIISEDYSIISAFENIFSPNVERFLVLGE
ncbi:TlpA family protein disulfide reductase [Capnocytophaga canis]|uniref:TlpA family protein disulfide reductase n=1 Tax=Capnocytophaga canis TaxID=1848903 RepID=UPI001F504688|nr:thioredoxin-like domain-containing protein [Capnocytophaga canis]